MIFRRRENGRQHKERKHRHYCRIQKLPHHILLLPQTDIIGVSISEFKKQNIGKLFIKTFISQTCFDNKCLKDCFPFQPLIALYFEDRKNNIPAAAPSFQQLQ